ncbi:hypothetical protein L915_12495 [Phytophthora nicotianae]|uniref:Uncharacterized protein n=1 Tax=Phytophthora nicotianae TaxID=4792 RepID=W2GGE9_PHYNI|nr:hypothetical protein L915_12495 [Phytophthora nicotianae]
MSIQSTTIPKKKNDGSDGDNKKDGREGGGRRPQAAVLVALVASPTDAVWEWMTKHANDVKAGNAVKSMHLDYGKIKAKKQKALRQIPVQVETRAVQQPT